MKYDAESNTVTDFAGDKVYEPLAVSNSFKLYDTGILVTRADMNYAYTNFWNLITGEEIPLEWYEATEENVNNILK